MFFNYRTQPQLKGLVDLSCFTLEILFPLEWLKEKVFSLHRNPSIALLFLCFVFCIVHVGRLLMQFDGWNKVL